MVAPTVVKKVVTEDCPLLRQLLAKKPDSCCPPEPVLGSALALRCSRQVAQAEKVAERLAAREKRVVAREEGEISLDSELAVSCAKPVARKEAVEARAAAKMPGSVSGAAAIAALRAEIEASLNGQTEGWW